MTITLNLDPEVEKELIARARERGLSVHDCVDEVVRQGARAPVSSKPSSAAIANLSDLLLGSPFAGANLNVERLRDYPRPVEIK